MSGPETRLETRPETGPEIGLRRSGRSAPRGPDTAFLVVMILAAAASLWPIYQHTQVLVLVAGAVALGTLVAVLAARGRWPAYAVAAATIVVYLVFGVGLAIPAEAAFGVLPTLGGVRQLFLGTMFGWKQMLSVALPLGAYEGLLVPALIIVLGATVAGVSVVLRSSRPAWALAAPATVWLFGIGFGSATAFWPLVCGAALTAVGLLWAVRGIGWNPPRARGAESRRLLRRDRLRRSLAAGTLTLVCVAAGAVLASAAPSAVPRQVARNAVQPPFDAHAYISPLVGFRNSVLPPGKDEPQFTVTDLPNGARIRLAILDDYDGLVFAAGSVPASGAFERVPLRVERQDPVEGQAVKVRFRVEGLSGVWLPTVGSLGSIHFTGDSEARAGDFFYNRTADAAALLGGTDRGLEYTVSGTFAADPSAERIARLRPGTTVQSGTGDIPEAVADAARQHSGDGSAGQRLLALAEWLRTGYVSDSGEGELFSRPGHSGDRLAALVSETPMLGDAEQYAPAFALLAREVGFPARVVLGYAPQPLPGSDGGSSVTVHGSDLTAWVEVQSSTGEWFPIDPNPPEREAPEDNRTTSDIIAHPQTVPPPPPVTKDDAVSSSAGEDDDTAPDDDPPAWLGILSAILGVAGIVVPIVALVLAPFWVTALIRRLLSRARRRRDRRAGALTGAWDDVADRIAERGGIFSASATRREIAALAPTPAVLLLADCADRAVFDRERLTDDEIDRHWNKVAAARASITATASRWERLRLAVTWRAIRARIRQAWMERRHNTT